MENIIIKQYVMNGWKMQLLRTQVRVRRGGKRKYKFAGLEYASTENISTYL